MPSLSELVDAGRSLDDIMSADGGDCEAVLGQFAEALAAQLQDEGVGSFVASWNEFIGVIASRSDFLKQTD